MKKEGILNIFFLKKTTQNLSISKEYAKVAPFCYIKRMAQNEIRVK